MAISPDLLLLGKAALAGALGFAVGWEREAHGHAAGVRTIALITMGATIFTGIAFEVFPVVDRVVANILTGVGFLGAGLILHGRTVNQNQIYGLTTAASIWAMTGVGVVVGVGHPILALGLTACILLLLWWPYIPFLSRINPAPTRRKMAARQAAMREQHDAPPSA
jgi:putative Mg2+ transporter-C (MgtC) family protein